ncbi:MAG: L-2-amino-thiazoline-4-carboxylic acid hydrolase [Saccharofermentans sp.]|nr:L-2-amino-thiazoline-4-carboxylic acid hydrolase [Saccharofermentans sp.]
MVRERFSSDAAENICKMANVYSDEFTNSHPDAYGSALKVSYPFAGVYKAMQKYVSKQEALQMMMDYAPVIGEKQRKVYWRFTSIPGIPSLLWANFGKIMKVAGGEKAGYKSRIYGVNGNQAGMDVLSCPVVNALAEIGMPEVAPVMCAIDQVYSTGYRGIDFRRTKSVAEGDDCCDYRYMRVKK